MLACIDHVNLVVHDLPAMTAFYRDVLGLRVTKEVTIRGDWVASVVGLREVEADVVYLELPDGPRIELIAYRTPPPVPRPDGLGSANTPGLRHLAFRVDDIDTATSRLRERGVHVFSDVQAVPDTQVTYAGGVRKRLVYFADPEGNILELCCYA